MIFDPSLNSLIGAFLGALLYHFIASRIIDFIFKPNKQRNIRLSVFVVFWMLVTKPINPVEDFFWMLLLFLLTEQICHIIVYNQNRRRSRK